MQVVDFAPSRIAGLGAKDALRRIDGLAFLSKTASRLTARRRWDFEQAIDQARNAVLRGDAAKLEATMAALDLLSLEICDD